MVRQFLGACALCTLFVVSLSGCGSSDSPDPPTSSSGSSGEAIEVVLMDTMTFEPSSITVSPGETVTLNVTNEGALPHNFSIEGLDVDVDVAAGETETATFTAPSSPGEHKIFCNQMGHEGAGMVGSFIVEE
jgi:plastocyanin